MEKQAKERDIIPNIVFDESVHVTSRQLILALFGKPAEEVVREIRDGKNGEYAYLFKKRPGTVVRKEEYEEA